MLLGGLLPFFVPETSHVLLSLATS